MTIGFGSRHSPVPGMNPEVLDDDAEVEELVEVVEELLLLATVVLAELDEELAFPPPEPPFPSTVTSVEQPACIPNPSDTNNALANTSRDERRGAAKVRFMMDPPRAEMEHRSCHCEKLVSSKKTSRYSAPRCAGIVIRSHWPALDRNATHLAKEPELSNLEFPVERRTSAKSRARLYRDGLLYRRRA
jgi:hypothetical protein